MFTQPLSTSQVRYLGASIALRAERREPHDGQRTSLIIIWYLLHRSISYLKPTTTVLRTGVVNVPSVLTTTRGKLRTIWPN